MSILCAWVNFRSFSSTVLLWQPLGGFQGLRNFSGCSATCLGGPRTLFFWAICNAYLDGDRRDRKDLLSSCNKVSDESPGRDTTDFRCVRYRFPGLHGAGFRVVLVPVGKFWEEGLVLAGSRRISKRFLFALNLEILQERKCVQKRNESLWNLSRAISPVERCLKDVTAGAIWKPDIVCQEVLEVGPSNRSWSSVFSRQSADKEDRSPYFVQQFGEGRGREGLRGWASWVHNPQQVEISEEEGVNGVWTAVEQGNSVISFRL